MSKFDVIKDLASSKLARPLLQLQKHSPRILFVAGTVGVVGTVVLACRATLKVSDALDLHEKRQADVQKIDSNARYGQDDNALEALDKSRDKQLRALKIRTAMEITKPYLPAVALGIISIGALTGSHVILAKRNGAVMAAYAALDRGYREYRQRVVAELGEDADRKFASAAVAWQDVDEKMADGSIKTTSKMVHKQDGRFGGSPYAFIFDEQSHKFSKEPGANAHTVSMVQDFADRKLRAQGHLFLNDVHDLLGMPRTRPGAVIGWIYDPKNPDHKGDNYVDFGIFTVGDHEDVAAFIDGHHYYVTIDPNVDGTIWDKI